MRARLAGILTLSLFSLAPFGAARAQDYFETWPAELQHDVTQLYRTFPGEITFAVKDLSTGVRYTHNSATPMYIASGIKIAVMVELFRQVRAKQISLDEEIVYGPMDVRDGAPVLSYLRPGTPVTIRLLLEAMINRSDNAATDMIMRRIGVPNVNKGLVKEGIFGFGPITTLLDVRKLVYKDIDPRAMHLSPNDLMLVGVAENIDGRLIKLAEILHEPPGVFARTDLERAYRNYYRTGYNTAPLDAMLVLLERLAKGKLVAPESSKQMLDVMMKTSTGPRRLRAGFPPNTPFAHKTGTQYQRICDFGVFYMSPERPIVIAACVKGGGSRRKAEDVLAYLAHRTYWHLTPPEKRRSLPELVLQPMNGEGDDAEGEVPVSATKRPKRAKAQPVKHPKKE
jgi:beta-lactamase class A